MRRAYVLITGAHYRAAVGKIALALLAIPLGAASLTVAAPPRVARSCGTIADFAPAWSPNGRSVAFTRLRAHGAVSGVFAISADGTGLHRISPVGDYAYDAVWSPTGNRIAYMTFDDAAVARVVVARADGAAARIVASFQDERDPPFTYLSWSPDGRSVLFADPHTGLVTADDAGVRLLVPGGTQPAWSPDGRRIAFVAVGGLSVANADGTRPQVIARGGFPAWSPDGTRITYTGQFETGIHVIRADGTGDRLVERKGALSQWVTSSMLVYADRAVRVADLRTSHVRTVSHDSSRFFGSENFGATAHGRTIAFTSAPTVGGSEIRLVGIDGRGERRLTYHCALAEEGAGGRVYGTWLGDVVLARNHLRDRVFCGAGRDIAYVDRRDRVARDCELVRGG